MQFLPTAQALVVGTIHHTGAEIFYVQVSPYTPLATLPQLAFEGATKKTRPMLVPGDLVYARIVSASKHLDPELSCVYENSAANGLGPLKGGMVFDVSETFARRLGKKSAAKTGLVILEVLGERVPFEVAVGANGRVWVGGNDSTRVVIGVGRALKIVDEKDLSEQGQRQLATRILKDITTAD
jgi:exosome complex component RRP40